MNTLDWKKLKQFVKDRKPLKVSAGILNDWFWTASTVYEDGKYIKDHNAYVTSDWATPGFKATLENGDVIEVVAHRKQTKQEAGEYKRKSIKARKDMAKLAKELQEKLSTNPPKETHE